MKSRTLMALVLPLLLTACGGDSVTPPTPVTLPPAPAATPTPTPAPTPTPSLNHTGTYSGTIDFTITGVPAGSFPARLEVKQDGDTLDLGTLDLPGFGSFPLETATMTSPTEFTGSGGYGSVGCGRVKVSTQGTFAGQDMHLIAGLTSNCIQARLSGDLSR